MRMLGGGNEHGRCCGMDGAYNDCRFRCLSAVSRTVDDTSPMKTPPTRAWIGSPPCCLSQFCMALFPVHVYEKMVGEQGAVRLVDGEYSLPSKMSNLEFSTTRLVSLSCATDQTLQIRIRVGCATLMLDRLTQGLPSASCIAVLSAALQPSRRDGFTQSKTTVFQTSIL